MSRPRTRGPAVLRAVVLGIGALAFLFPFYYMFIGSLQREPDQTVAGALSAKNQDGIELITTEPAESAYSNEYIEQALAELEEEGVEVGGEYTPIDVVLTEGGQ